MTLAPGTRIGPYEVVALLGTGGMGEGYRATDPRLGRDAAIKVLPEATLAGADRVASFSREARLLASINHPNIATLYGVEDLDGSTAIVMEVVEGPSLADFVAPGPIGVTEALQVAVDHAGGVGAGQAGSDVDAQPQQLVDRESAGYHASGERRAVDQLHRHERDAVALVGVVDRDDVGIGQRRDDARFTQQPCGVGRGPRVQTFRATSRRRRRSRAR